MDRIRISNLQWAVGSLCILQGALMLIAPHQFSFIPSAVFQAAINEWGVIFFLTGCFIYSLPFVQVARWVSGAGHLLPGLLLTGLGAGFGLAGAWVEAVHYGLAGLAIGLAWLLPRPQQDETGYGQVNLFAALAGVSAGLTGILLWLFPLPPAGRIGLPPPLLNQVFGSLFVAGGAWLTAYEIPHLRQFHFQPASSPLSRLLTAPAWLPNGLVAGLYWASLVAFLPEHRTWVTVNLFGLYGLILIVSALLGARLHRIGHTSLRAHLALALALAVIVPLGMTATLLSKRQEASVKVEALARQESLAVAVAQNVADYIRLHRYALNTLAAYPDLADLPRDEQARILRQYQNAFPEVASFTIYREDGSPVLRSDGISTSISIAGMPIFKEAQRTGSSGLEVIISPVLNQPVVWISTALIDRQGNFRGVCILSLRTSHIAGIISLPNYHNSDLIFIVAKDGRIIAHPNARLAETFASQASRAPVLASNTSGNNSGSLDFKDQGELRLAGYSRVQGLDWEVIVETPSANFLTQAYQDRELAYGILLAFLFVSVLAGFILAGYLIAPLKTLANAADQLSAGNWDAPLPMHGIAEVDHLAQIFRRMRYRLAERTSAALAAEQALRQANEELEGRVAERTEALQAATLEAQQSAFEASQRSSEQVAVFQALSEAVIVYDQEGKVRQANAAALKIYGFDPTCYTLSELYRRVEVYRRDGSRLSQREMPSRRAMTGERVTGEQLIFANQNGQRYEVIASATPMLADGRLIGVVGVWHDITELVKAETALRSSERWLRTILDNLPVGVWYTDEKGVIIYGNPEGQHIWSGAKYVGATEYDVYRAWWADTGEMLKAEDWALARAIQHGETSLNEALEIECFDGTHKFIHNSAVPVKNEAQQVIGAVVVNEDITERRLAEQSLRDSETHLRQLVDSIASYNQQLERVNRDLQNFAFIASHDLQEPLRKIQAFGERLQVRFGHELEEEGSDYIRRMTSSAARMQTMINDLLSYSRLSTRTRPFELINLTHAAYEAVSDLEAQADSTKGQIHIGELPTIEADHLQMRLLFQNLIANGLKFHRPGVPPLVKVYGKLISGQDLPSDPAVQLFIEDNGIGFDLQYLDRIFQPFQRLHGRGEFEGTGIGLALCRRIVERHNGTITAFSQPGEGAIFTVTLPVKQLRKE